MTSEEERALIPFNFIPLEVPMTPITLDAIKAEHAKVAEMIAAFEAQSKIKILVFPELEIELQPGEQYSGIITGKTGELSHHVILLPGDEDGLTWSDARTWATQAGGELPTCREQALLYANLKEQFQSTWYWSGEPHDDDSGYAWGQYFGDSSQIIYDVSLTFRARAVRRLAVCRCVAASVEKENQNETGN